MFFISGAVGKSGIGKIISVVMLACAGLFAAVAAAEDEDMYFSEYNTADYYVLASSGELLPNKDYSVTDFIPVEAGEHYIIPRNRMLAFYNSEKGYISGIENGASPLEFVAPVGSTYVRISINKTWRNFFMYALNTLQVNLPSRICMYNGAPLTIYHDGLLPGGAGKYFFKWSCPVGRAMKDSLVFDAGIAPGTYSLKLEVFDENMSKLTESSSKLVVNDGKGEHRKLKLLIIGDSLSNDKPWEAGLEELSKTAVGPGLLTMVGTCGGDLKHEARSGYTTTGYVGDSRYQYQGNYKLKLSTDDCTVPPKTRCKVRTTSGNSANFEVEGITRDNGTWLHINRLTVAGNLPGFGTVEFLRRDLKDKVAYTEAVCTSCNPFWNPDTKRVDFSYYEKKTSIRPDVVLLFLGTNDYDSSKYPDNMAALIGESNRTWNVPVLVVLPPFRGPQDVMGRQFGTQMYSAEAHRVMFSQHRSGIEKLSGMSNVVLVPLSLCFDAENNYGGHDAVHPVLDGKGYTEMADAIFGALLFVWK